MDVDFLIIGGGIAGVSAAARLSLLGSVLLLEAETTLAYHASGRSAAFYEPTYGAPPVVELSMASGAYLHEAANILSKRGMMIVGTETEELAFRAFAEHQELPIVTLDEARAVVPILNPAVVRYAAWGEHGWDIDTDLLLQGFVRMAKSRGAQIRTGARVSKIARIGKGWQVSCNIGTFTAGTLVNAAGPWVDAVAAMAGIAPLGFQPLRRSMARIPAPGGHDISSWPMLMSTGETWYAKPDAGALMVSPSEEHLMEPHDAFADDMVLAEGLARYEAMVTEPVTRLLANWAGLRTFAPDRVLVIGRDVAEPSFFWLAGQGGYGFQSSPAASQLAADLIGGQPSDLGADLVAALSPARFG